MLVMVFFFGLVIGIIIMAFHRSITKNDTSETVILSGERKGYLFGRMDEIFKTHELSMDEIVNIITGNRQPWNNKMLNATNELADLIANEQVDILEGNELLDLYMRYLFLNPKFKFLKQGVG